jgi:hypothetical protein
MVYHNSLRWHGVLKNAREQEGGGARKGRKDTEKSAKFVIDRDAVVSIA